MNQFLTLQFFIIFTYTDVAILSFARIDVREYKATKILTSIIFSAVSERNDVYIASMNHFKQVQRNAIVQPAYSWELQELYILDLQTFGRPANLSHSENREICNHLILLMFLKHFHCLHEVEERWIDWSPAQQLSLLLEKPGMSRPHRCLSNWLWSPY